jgi:predicted alpha/beta superfamily hydrolase
MGKKTFTAGGKEVTMYLSDQEDRPVIILNNFSGDGGSVMEALLNMDCPEFNLLSVGNLNWDHDMSPWYCPSLAPNDNPCTGGADEYLEVLLNSILPEAKSMIKGTPSFTGIAGYSLAGLFALYAITKCDCFDRAASMSGSLWFPDFKDYVLSTPPMKRPDKIYLSLGDREAKTRNRILQTVQVNTELIAAHYRDQGLDVTYELNPGNHFRDPAIRSAKGIKAIL